jgi:hypothetical protein
MTYAWIIDIDHLASDFTGDEKGITGPRGAPPELLAKLQAGEGEKFEMYDDDQELYYTGRIVGRTPGDTNTKDFSDYIGFEPLDDFGEPNAGCTGIKYGGEWL